jgi:hypothetical protein
MKALFAVVVVAMLLWLSYEREQDKRTITLLAAKQNSTPETPSFELQSKCADAAARAFKQTGYNDTDNAGFTDHFNGKLQKCFMTVKASVWNRADGTVTVSKNVYDAMEFKQYGEYLWTSDKVKKRWEVLPLLCDGTAIDGSYKKCSSEGEFVSLMSDYMDVGD